VPEQFLQVRMTQPELVEVETSRLRITNNEIKTAGILHIDAEIKVGATTLEELGEGGNVPG
jgi:hypothetical protein